MQILAVATKNEGKLKEIKQILGHLYDVRSATSLGADMDVEETGASFEENAVIKALALHRVLGVPVLSDDSGIAVDALGGKPGIYSARFSAEGTDEANNKKLLAKLEGCSDRRAKYICAIALVRGENDIIVTLGQAEGEVLPVAAGGGGFGYDPLFFSYDLGKTFGQATAEEKNAVSHRFRALQSLLHKIS